MRDTVELAEKLESWLAKKWRIDDHMREQHCKDGHYAFVHACKTTSRRGLRSRKLRCGCNTCDSRWNVGSVLGSYRNIGAAQASSDELSV
eukprot:6178050-Amphidinium_carterae.1